VRWQTMKQTRDKTGRMLIDGQVLSSWWRPAAAAPSARWARPSPASSSVVIHRQSMHRQIAPDRSAIYNAEFPWSVGQT
jgi:hypothetical protein